ncbi:MAG: HAMP domain-containing histidine kinase [Thermoguttaceae bacterium]|nr:HAMP domain-containing histidine kinase [Thermoguttaceae bacterium]
MRRSLGLPITMAVIMIVLVILLIVGWTISTIWAATSEPKAPTFFWALLPIGALSLTVILAGVIIYLVLSVKLINLNLRQSNFIDAVTHELKSPLASLKLQVQTLERLNIPEEKRQLIYQAMKNDVDRLEALINQVLMVSVLKSKPDKKLAESSANLLDILEMAANNSCIRHKVNRGCVSVNSCNATIVQKRFAIELILQNIIDNAVKYASSENPQIDVRSRISQNGRLVVRVSDNGPGIPTGQRKKIFLRFYRIGNELERKKTGTGLGLYIVKMLTRQIRGKLYVRDRSTGNGIAFVLVLPARVIDANTAKGAA